MEAIYGPAASPGRCQRMKTTLFLLGSSDNEAQSPTSKERVQGGVMVTTDFAGVLPILPYVMSDRIMSANSHTVGVGVHDIELTSNARVNLLNLVGDADSSAAMLHNIETIACRVKPARLSNQPRHVFRTPRALVPARLRDIILLLAVRNLRRSSTSL